MVAKTTTKPAEQPEEVAKQAPKAEVVKQNQEVGKDAQSKAVPAKEVEAAQTAAAPTYAWSPTPAIDQDGHVVKQITAVKVDD